MRPRIALSRDDFLKWAPNAAPDSESHWFMQRAMQSILRAQQVCGAPHLPNHCF
jgi:hypothetical protein